MKSTRKQTRVPAENIACLADQGKDVSRFFTNAGQMMSPIQRVNVDFASPMLDELDNVAKELNINRQAVIKISCPNMLFAALVTASLARRKEQGCQTGQREACPPPSSAQGSIPWFLLFGSSRF